MTLTRVVVVAFVTLCVPAAWAGQELPPGFEPYVLGLMTRGSAAIPPAANAEALQKAHLANLTKMFEEGLLVASGPIGDSGDLRGVLIFRGDRRVIETRVADDPLIQAGRLKITLKPWMGPRDIGAGYKQWAAANPGAPDKMHTYQLVLMRPVPTAAPLTPPEQIAHLKNMDAMVKDGHLVMAGPVLEPGDLAGIFVFDTDAARAESLAASDPAVVGKKMSVERHPWMVAEQVIPKGFKVPLP